MEYIFFDAALRDKFVHYAQELQVNCSLRDDNMGLLVAVSDELSDELHDALEAFYEGLQDEQTQLLSQTEGGFKNMAGFSLVLPDGSISTVPLQPDVANRLLATFSIEEIQALFSSIARCALEPQQRPVCEILHRGGIVGE